MSSVSASSSGLVPGERREVAVLFLDLHGFTALSEEMDHETVHRLNSGIMRALSRTVQAHGGYIDKYEGDRIMALFGAVRAHPDDCVRAVSAGLRLLEIVDEIRGILLDRGMSIGARVGISYGNVTVAPDPSDHLTASGDCVNIASRMESSAEVGTIQVTVSVRDRCGGSFEWLDLGEREVRGRRKTVHAFRPTGFGRDMITGRQQISGMEWDFVNRSMELELMDSLFGGGSSFIILRGHDGHGKTRTALEWLRRKVDDGKGAGLYAVASPYAQTPFHLWISILAPELDEDPTLPLDEDERKCILELMGRGEWQAGKALNPAALSEFRTAAFCSAAAMVLERTRPGNLFLVVDDLQRLDSSSAEVLLRLIGSDGVFILSCMTPFTEDGPQDCAPFLDRVIEAAEVIDLQPLSREATRGLVRNMLSASGTEPSDRILDILEDAVQTRSTGIPFITVETVKLLLERGVIVCRDGGWSQQSDSWQDTVPDSVRGLIRCRLDSLSRDERRLLQVASLAGHRFDIAVMEEVVRRLIPELAELTPDFMETMRVEGIIQKSPVMEDGLYEFVNPLFPEIASSTLLRLNRTAIHSAIAGCMVDFYGEHSGRYSSEIAMHWRRAGSTRKAVNAGIAALKYLSENYQNDECLVLSGIVESWLADLPPEERGTFLMDVLINRQKVQYRMGLFEGMETTLRSQLEVASGRGLDAELGKTFCSLGELRRMQGDDPEARVLLGKAIEYSGKAGDLNTLGMSLSNLGALLHEKGDSEASEECFRKAVAVQEECGNRRSAGIAMLNLSAVLRVKGNTSQSAELMERAMECFRESSFRTGEAQVLLNLAVLDRDGGNIQEAIEHARKAVSIHRETGYRVGMAAALGFLGSLLSDSRPQEAVELLREAVQLSSTTGRTAIMLDAMLWLAGALLELDRKEEAVESFKNAAGLLGSGSEHRTPELLDGLKDVRNRLIEAGAVVPDLQELT